MPPLCLQYPYSRPVRVLFVFLLGPLAAVDSRTPDGFDEDVPHPSSAPRPAGRHRRSRRFSRLLSLPAAGLVLALGGVGIITFNPFEVASDPGGDPAQLLTATPESAPLPTQSPTPTPSPPSLPTPNLQAAPQPPVQERFMTDLSRAAVLADDIDAPESLLVVVNKQRPFRDKKYAPKLRAVLGSDHELRPDAAEALEQMLAAAADDGVDFQVLSAYRSYERQKTSRVNAGREASADRVDELSARPGFSEHQSGLAVDLGMTNGKCELKECFAETAGGQWVQENATKFGFIERYPKGQRDVTGYVYEPWHLRFIGVEAAADMLRSGAPTLEEFFGLAPAPDY